MKQMDARNIISKFIVVTIVVGACFALSCKEDTVGGDCPREDNGSGSGVQTFVDCTPAVLGSDPSGAAGGIFNTTAFLDMIEDSLDGVLGYQIAVGWNGSIVGTRSFGTARSTEDCILDFNQCNRMNGASIAKNLTAAATLKLLEANNLTVDSLVAPHLPASWDPTTYAKALSFRHFLAHRSALPSANNNFGTTLSYSGLQTFVQSTELDEEINDPADPDQNTYVYKNANFALMRIVIPQLWKNLPDAPQELKDAVEITDELSKKYYEQYIKTKLLAPSGVNEATLNMDGNDEATLYYDFAASEAGTGYTFDWRGIAGGGGWWISARDLVKYMQGIQNNDAILSPANRTLMYGHPTLGWRFGFNRSIDTSRGTGQGHGGSIGSYLSGVLFHMPENISICIMANSDHPTQPNYGNNMLQSWIGNCYDAAWE